MGSVEGALHRLHEVGREVAMEQDLNNIGLLMQALGVLALTVQTWRKGEVFDTTVGGLTDNAGRWPALIRWGLILYMLGYLPLVLAVNIPKSS